jgi:hypothetical protein
MEQFVLGIFQEQLAKVRTSRCDRFVRWLGRISSEKELTAA